MCLALNQNLAKSICDTMALLFGTPYCPAGVSLDASHEVLYSKYLNCATVPDTHKFPLDARIRIASHARIRIASHRMWGNARLCEHSHRMREMRAFASHARKCAHSHSMRGNARIPIACAEMRALRRERRVNEIAGMTPARVFWRQTPVVVRCIHKYWG